MVLVVYITPVMYSDISGYAPEWMKTAGIILSAIAVVAVAVLTAGAVIAAAPAIAAFASTTAFAYTGSLALASAAATAISIGAAATAISTIAIGVNEGIGIVSGYNILRNTMGDSLYNGFVGVTGLMSYGYIVGGSMLPYPSTGSKPKNLTQDLSIREAKSNPNAGAMISRINMKDPRMPGWLGWSKYQMNVNGQEIHYVGNRYIPQWFPFQTWFDFKIKAGE